MENTKEQVQYSDYMMSRSFNQKLYDRLKEELEEVVRKESKKCPDVTVTISMSAKYQTPYLLVETKAKDGKVEIEGINHDVYGAIEHAAIDILDEVGFTHEDSEEKYGGYVIHFTD